MGLEEETLNVQPAYAESFGVASAHLVSPENPLSRGEGATSNVQLKLKPRSDFLKVAQRFNAGFEMEIFFLVPNGTTDIAPLSSLTGLGAVDRHLPSVKTPGYYQNAYQPAAKRSGCS